MRFIFYGSLDELKDTIYIKAKEHNKDIVIYDSEPNILEIGFERLGHSGGRFFVAKVIAESQKIILDGEFKEISHSKKQTKAGIFWNEFSSYLLAYIVLEIILIIPWLFLKNISSVWIPLLLPFIYLIIRAFLNKKENKKANNAFIQFLSLCTIYSQNESNGPFWDDVYKKLDLAGGTLKGICDDCEDMLLITYQDGMQIDVGLIGENKTYCITVLSNDTAEAWSAPLGEFMTIDKSKLPAELQKAIYKYRNIQG